MGKIVFGKFEFEGKTIRTARFNYEFVALVDVATAVGVTRATLTGWAKDCTKTRVSWQGTSPVMVFANASQLARVLRTAPYNHAQRLAAEIELRRVGIADSQKVENKESATSELIPLTEDESGATAVSGRALHEFLGIGKDYSTWFKDMAGYGFTAGQDFTPISGKTSAAGGRPRTDHVVTLDMAKELSMIQRTERGKQARQYFIEVEKQAKATPQFEVPQTYAAALRAAADATDRADLAERKVTELEPRAKGYDRFMDDDGHLMTWDRVARLLGLGKVGMLASLRAEGILMRGRKGETWNIPYQAYQHHFDMKVWEGKARNGDPITSTKVRVKPSGLDFIAKRLGVEEVAA